MCLRNHYSMRQGLLNMLPHQKLNTTLKCLNFVLQVVDIFCFNASGCSDSGSKDGRRPPKMVTKSTDPGVLFQTLVYNSKPWCTIPSPSCCAIFLLLFLLVAFFCQQIEVMLVGNKVWYRKRGENIL